MSLVDQVRTAIESATEITRIDLFNDPLLLAVSGGPDSLALLHSIQSLRPIDGLAIAHLDHGLRPESASEAQLVGEIAGGIPFYSERCDVAALAQAQRLTIEEAGRLARLDFLASVARQIKARGVLVGHNADDQAETILMHILRGSGLEGLSGMRLASILPGCPDLWQIRPLLRTSRTKIEEYCLENGLKPLIDASNEDRAFFRNRLRHELLPTLETYNPQIRQRLRNMGEVVAVDADLLDQLTEKAWLETAIIASKFNLKLRRPEWLALPLSLRRRTLRRAIALIRPELRDISFRTLEAARVVAEGSITGSKAALPGGVILSVGYDELVLSTGPEAPSEAYPQLLSDETLSLPIPGMVELAYGWRLSAEWMDDVDIQTILTNRDPWTCYVNAISDEFFVRPRMKGERMQPLGLGGEAKLKEIMINRKIPAVARKRWPIVSFAGHAIWLVGHVLDERARVVASSQPVARLTCFRG